ncbi:MAG: hypothetical protein KJ558_12975 [Gammaproteobacteria bacterium]|nr:hypothetical protein [Gammaproteobacteria bacterium]MBU1655712.1 hypothetical protein [Gammaproteobacteria bacterium]MBU1962074.1 hypothetical protein [Gammaproteobacteria bacterium]
MIEQTIGELLQDKVKLDVEGIDRLYLNAYQPMFQTGGWRQLLLQATPRRQSCFH